MLVCTLVFCISKSIITLLNKMEMHITINTRLLHAHFYCILSFRSPHYACPEVIRVSWLILVYINLFFEVSLIASTQINPLYKKSAQGRGKGKDTRNLTGVLFVWLSPESSHIDGMREIIVCYSHSTLRIM